MSAHRTHRSALLRHDLDQPAPGFASPSASTWYAPDLPLEPVHLVVRADLDLDAHSLDGEVTVVARATRDDARTLVLDAVELHDVDVDAEVPLQWRYDGSKLHLTWQDGAARGEERAVTVRYRVVEPRTGLFFGGPSAHAPQGGRWAATDHETERARYWLPCVDHPAVRCTLDVHLTAAAGLTLLGPGALQGETTAGGRTTAHWKLDFPCPSYLLTFCVGELVRADGPDHQGKPVAAFAPAPHTAEDLARSFGRTTEFLDWMTGRLARPLPWPKYFQYALPGFGGAMENISLVSWDDAWVMNAHVHPEMGWLTDLINVHEMAHTWFGDAVVCRDFAHSWLKESWATYIETVWIQENWSADDGAAWLHAEWRQYHQETKRYKRPIRTRRFDSSWDLFDGHLYPGGAVRLHLLRHTVGDAAFWRGVTAYLERFHGKVAETDDFRRVMEEHSGQSLGRFFDQWFGSPGHPELEVTTAWDAERGVLTVTAVQAQVDADADKAAKAGIPCFHVDVPLAIETDGGWTRAVLPLRDRRAVVTVALDGAPLQVVVDPDTVVPHALSKFDPGDDMLVRSMTACPHVRGRLRAAELACQLGRPALIRGVGALYRAESLWIVRMLVAQYLGDSKSPQAAVLLSELLLEESDPKVMRYLAASCGRHRHPTVAQALRRWLQGDDLPDAALGTALASLGAQRGEEQIAVIAPFLDVDSAIDRVRSGAVAGLGATRADDALPLIEARLPADAGHVYLRGAAAAALADAVAWADKGQRARVAEQLTDLTGDDAYRVRIAAGRALASLGDAEHAGVVEAVADSLAGQDRPAFRRLAAGLRGGGSDGKALEELTDLVRQLRERVDDLEAKLDGALHSDDA
ncbi:MAG: M1 family metallopeptidase [Alphaproteobacteria bacterium]|nr:M1 family metallopeptidase [Alphaproteobacteria bacterium]